MKAYILYQKASEQERSVEGFCKELKRLRVEYELVEGDSAQGISLNELYDLPARPAVILVRNDGQAVQRWQGTLPLPSDISYLAHQ